MAAKVLILGIGNLLMGDEGIGVRCVQALDESRLPDFAEVVDGGTGGFHLLSLLQDYPAVILVDASLEEAPPGTVTLRKPRFASDFPRSLSAHDIGLRDLVESAALLGGLPEMFLITVSVSRFQEMSMELSPQVEAAIPEVHRMIFEILQEKAVA